ncbi:cell division protein FtsI (penicillin-binding protein 3) [Rhodovulum iodosum]|uniref:Cell division protein FtsI (Penicillin-binding protein 3) n=1 Tax=Rhodovulum iodosum TaxID=68291 RepID=A0ABV3XPT6_9RHOB|nr:penicillin-binding protein 2 [Rhodovulum robiginosum]RSK37995.1 penicillin-binding protein 2 [Rhodovulum robiginosum]
MIRTPLRPLARILEARARGENPDAIERENLRLRHEQMRDRARARAEGRLFVLGVMFFCAFTVVGARMGLLAASEPSEPRAAAPGAAILAQRADITDRNGRVLATNLATHSLYAQPPIMIDKARAARDLAEIFPDLDEEELLAQFTGKRKFLWLKKKISPEQKQLVHDIGDPGLLFGPREMRLYPNGTLAAHVLGGASFGREGVQAAEVIGTAGVEKAFDGYLRDPANGGAPLRLSLDLTVQAAVERVLQGGMKLMNAKGAAAVLMDVRTGELISLVSLPDFDPNERPRPLTSGDAGDSPLFNRAVQGVYELGSTFKIFAAAQALDLGLANPQTMIDTKGPLTWGRYRIRDFHNYGPELSLTDVIVKSSNIGTARVAVEIGAKRQREFLDSLGFLEATPVELVEAPGAQPLLPKNWSEISTMTISYGHGLSASPLHLAAAYATVLNGGTRVRPTLLAGAPPQAGERVISERTSQVLRSMLRQVVQRGTASFGEVPGYAVGGKTGTADKPKPRGGYYKDKVIATFASVFPAHAPRYVLIVTLDEPEETSGSEPRRTAGWTAVPVAAEIIRRAAPLLGLRPEIEPGAGLGVTLTSN